MDLGAQDSCRTVLHHPGLLYMLSLSTQPTDTEVFPMSAVVATWGLTVKERKNNQSVLGALCSTVLSTAPVATSQVNSHHWPGPASSFWKATFALL